MVTSPENGISRRDAATIIRVLGSRLLELYAVTHGATVASNQNGWGTKQRRKLLLALIEHVAENAYRCGNAALSATDAAIERFSRRNFREGATRSHRDREPITKNVDKLVGGWLRQFGRRIKQDAVIVTVQDDVELQASKGTFRLTLELRYPWRLISNRKLTIAASVAEVSAGGAVRPLAFASDPTAVDVALPDSGRRNGPRQTRQVEHLLRLLQLVADESDDEELAAYAHRGLQLFVPRSGAKMLVVAFAAMLAFATIAGAVEWVSQWLNEYRLLPKITFNCDPKPAVIMTFTRAPEGGVVVEKNGVPLPFRNGAAIDDRPALGTKNEYTVRAARAVFARHKAHISAEMPVCPPSVDATPPIADILATGRTGTFNLTVDKTALGDPPSVWPKNMTLQHTHMDEHLDPMVVEGCEDDACQYIFFRCYFGPIEGNDIQVTMNYGDGGAVQIFDSADAVSPSAKRATVDRDHPLFVRATPLGRTKGDVYSLHVSRYYPKEGSYVVSALVGARNGPNEPYRFVKELQRRVRVGTVATVEMTESYRLPETHSAPVPQAGQNNEQ